MGATISLWHYTEDDTIKRDDDLVEILTDKATFNVPSPVGGRIIKRFVSEGETVHTGDLLVTIESTQKPL